MLQSVINTTYLRKTTQTVIERDGKNDVEFLCKISTLIMMQ